MNQSKLVKYYKVAQFMANEFSKDPNTKVGCILLSKDSLHILCLGFNGFPRKVLETDTRWQRPTKYTYVCHAETNCLYNACRSGVCTLESIAICTLFPCIDCCKGLIQAGISKIVSPIPDYNNEKWGEQFKCSMEMFNEVGIEIELIENV